MGRHVTWIAWQAATTIALLLVVAVPRTGAGQTITVEAPNALSVAVVLAGTRPTVCPVPGLGSMLEALFAADVTYRNVSSAPLAVARGEELVVGVSYFDSAESVSERRYAGPGDHMVMWPEPNSRVLRANEIKVLPPGGSYSGSQVVGAVVDLRTTRNAQEDGTIPPGTYFAEVTLAVAAAVLAEPGSSTVPPWLWLQARSEPFRILIPGEPTASSCDPPGS